MSLRRVTDALFLAGLFSVSFIALRWRLMGLEPKLADFLMIGFLVAYLVEVTTHRRPPARPALVVLGCAGVLGVAYVAALPGIDGRTEQVQFSKGLGYFVLHFAFLAAGVDLLASRSTRFFRLALGCLLVGIAANGAYAGLQLLVASTGHNLDAAVLSPLIGRPARSLTYGLMYGPDTVRARGLTRDPNHLGVMLLLPTLAVLALAARAPELLRRPRASAAALAALLVVMALTLSRSAALGLAAGVLFLVFADGRRLLRRVVVAPAAAAVGVLVLVAANAQAFDRLLGARLGLYGFAGRQHFRTYELVQPALSQDPLFGVGLNNFTQTYAERVLGNLEASHSFYVQSLIETGILGTVLFALFFAFVVHRLRLLRADAEPDCAGARGALASALGAALVGTLVANAFYMTMSFSYFYAFLTFVIAAAARYGPNRSRPGPPSRPVADLGPRRTAHSTSGVATEAPG